MCGKNARQHNMDKTRTAISILFSKERHSCDCMARFSCDDEAVCYRDFTTVQTQRLKQVCDAFD